MFTSMSSEYLSAFTTACMEIGIDVYNQSIPVNKEKAGQTFLWLTYNIPEECDVWCGLAAATQLSSSILENITSTWKTRHNLEALIHIPSGSLVVTYDSGLYITFSIEHAEQLKLAHCYFLLTEQQWQQVSDILSHLSESAGNKFDSLWMHVALYMRTERWNDALEIITRIEELHPESVEKYQYEVYTAKAIAAAHLGMSNYALSLLREPKNYTDQLYVDATLTKALLLRASDRPSESLLLLEKLQTYSPDARIAEAINNPDYIIPVTTVEKIAERTDPWDAQSEPSVSQEQEQEQESQRTQLLNEAEKALDNFIGLQPVKDQIRRLRNNLIVQQERSMRSMAIENKNNHLIFAGPPGTGKTTIARVIAKIYCGLGVVKKESITEVNRAEIVGQHIGETEHKMNAIIDEALDGVLFIDEAYALVSTGAKNDFGLVAINTLLARMENDRDRLVVIIAGYPDDLNKFLSANEGLRSRFSRMIAFDSYTVDELMEMTVSIAEQRDTIFTEDALKSIRQLCQKLSEEKIEDSFHVQRCALDVAGNARFVRNIIERSEEEREDRIGQAINIQSFTNEDIMTCTKEDVDKATSVLLRNIGIKE